MCGGAATEGACWTWIGGRGCGDGTAWWWWFGCGRYCCCGGIGSGASARVCQSTPVWPTRTNADDASDGRRGAPGGRWGACSSGSGCVGTSLTEPACGRGAAAAGNRCTGTAFGAICWGRCCCGYCWCSCCGCWPNCWPTGCHCPGDAGCGCCCCWAMNVFSAPATVLLSELNSEPSLLMAGALTTFVTVIVSVVPPPVDAADGGTPNLVNVDGGWPLGGGGGDATADRAEGACGCSWWAGGAALLCRGSENGARGAGGSVTLANRGTGAAAFDVTQLLLSDGCTYSIQYTSSFVMF